MALATLSHQFAAREIPYVLSNGTRLVGDYRVDALLRVGGLEITYLASDLALGRTVAIKEFFPNAFAIRYPSNQVRPKSPSFANDYEWALNHFVQEAQTVENISHNTIVRVYRIFRANDTGYIVRHYEEGMNFHEWLSQLRRPPSQAELLAIVMPLLDALEFVHGHKLLHRDVAPDNIKIRRDGSPVLVDFGAAGGGGANGPREINAAVKPGFSPFEHYGAKSEEQGPWSDIYSLGATLYLAVTGKRPADAPSRTVEDNLILSEQAAANGYSPSFLQGIDHAMRLGVADRPQTVGEWRTYFSNAHREAVNQHSGSGTAINLSASAGSHSEQAGDLEMPAFLRKPSANGHELSSEMAVPHPGQRQTDIGTRNQLLLPGPRREPAQENDHVTSNERSARLPATRPQIAEDIEDALVRERTAAQFCDDKKKTRPNRLMDRLSAACDEEILDIGEPQRRPVPNNTTGPGTALRRGAVTGLVADRTVRPSDTPPAKKRRFFRRKKAATAKALPRSSPDHGADTKKQGLFKRRQQKAARPSPNPLSRISRGKKLKTLLYAMQLSLAVAIASAVVYFSEQDSSGQIGEQAQRQSTANDTKQPLVFKGHGGPVSSVAFSGDGRRILSGSADHSVKVWDSRTGQLMHTLRHHLRAVNDISVSGKYLVSADQSGESALWHLKTGERLRTYEYGGGAVAAAIFVGRKNQIAILGKSGNFKLFEGRDQTPSQHALRGHEEAIHAVAYSPRGSFLVTGSGDKTVKLWDGKTFKLIRTYRGHSGKVAAIAVSENGEWLATGSDDRTVKIWSTRSDKLLGTLRGHAYPLTAIAFSPNGKRLVSADSGSSVIKLWDLRSGTVLETYKGHGQTVRSVAFSPDGRKILSGSDDSTIRLWNVRP